MKSKHFLDRLYSGTFPCIPLVMAVAVTGRHLCSFGPDDDCSLWTYSAAFIVSGLNTSYPLPVREGKSSTTTPGTLFHSEVLTLSFGLLPQAYLFCRVRIARILTCRWWWKASGSTKAARPAPSFSILSSWNPQPWKLRKSSYRVAMLQTTFYGRAKTNHQRLRRGSVPFCTKVTGSAYLASNNPTYTSIQNGFLSCYRWHRHKVLLGSFTNPFRILLEVSVKLPSAIETPLLGIDNLHLEQCFAGQLIFLDNDTHCTFMALISVILFSIR